MGRSISLFPILFRIFIISVHLEKMFLDEALSVQLLIFIVKVIYPNKLLSSRKMSCRLLITRFC